jgi:hypothetical protein
MQEKTCEGKKSGPDEKQLIPNLVYMYAETAACSISLPIKTPEKVATVNTFFPIFLLTGG